MCTKVLGWIALRGRGLALVARSLLGEDAALAFNGMLLCGLLVPHGHIAAFVDQALAKLRRHSQAWL